MNIESLKKEFVPKYLATEEPKFYRFLLSYATSKLTFLDKEEYVGQSPELEFLDYYEQFLILYRREGEEVYYKLAKVFRRAAHKIYRVMLKKDMLEERNPKFLNLV